MAESKYKSEYEAGKRMWYERQCLRQEKKKLIDDLAEAQNTVERLEQELGDARRKMAAAPEKNEAIVKGCLKHFLADALAAVDNMSMETIREEAKYHSPQ